MTKENDSSTSKLKTPLNKNPTNFQIETSIFQASIVKTKTVEIKIQKDDVNT